MTAITGTMESRSETEIDERRVELWAARNSSEGLEMMMYYFDPNWVQWEAFPGISQEIPKF